MIHPTNFPLILKEDEVVFSDGKRQKIGSIFPTGIEIEPFGKASFSDAIDIFTNISQELLSTGAEIILIKEMTSIIEARAAVLAAKKTNLPIFVTICLDESGETAADTSPIAALVTLQNLGISGFGILYPYSFEEFNSINKSLSAVTHIPLISNYSHVNDDELEILVNSGIRIFKQNDGLEKRLKMLKFPQLSNDIDETSLLLSNETGVFYISADGLETSDKINCSVDMADQLLELSHTNFDVISVEILTSDDAYVFMKNAHMARLPVMFHSDNDAALEMALLTYTGRAMVDSRSAIPFDLLEKIASNFGAVVY